MKEVIVAVSVFVEDDVNLDDELEFCEGVGDALVNLLTDTDYSLWQGDYAVIPEDAEDDDTWALTHRKLKDYKPITEE